MRILKIVLENEQRHYYASIILEDVTVNVIGIDVSRGKSHATLITTDFEKQDFNFSRSRYSIGSAQTVEVEMIKGMLRNQNKINNYLVDYYCKLKGPPYSRKDLVAQIACVNHLNRTIMYFVHTNQSYDYQQAVRQ
ncbi:hypothetical protein [uncultured Lactobacillus sp.]|uniref:hypothetical protein n=1 Tax=uncultured Lactobacillus sp. TaxID=153152 RepID=UPI0025ECBA2D|nr:hypothetical protein [uncultured Lactobacillus sp.]